MDFQARLRESPAVALSPEASFPERMRPGCAAYHRSGQRLESLHSWSLALYSMVLMFDLHCSI